MTTQEMHIEIDLMLQKINSQSTKNILPQEKDWFLNNAAIDYIQQIINPPSNVKQLGFEDTAKRVEDIKDLVRIKNRVIQTNSRGESYITFPSDYFGYIRFDGLLRKACSPIVTPASTVKFKNIFKVEFPYGSIITFRIIITVNGAPITIFELTDLPDGYINIDEEFSKQGVLVLKALKILLPKKLATVLSPNTELYWEKEGENYSPSSFIIVSDTPFDSVTTRIVTNSSEVTETTTNAYSHAYSLYSLIQTPLKAKIRVVDDEFLTDVENSSLSKSRANSPVSVIREDCLYLSKPSNAIYGNVDMVYICKPNLIDLLLNSDLNVSDKVAKQVTAKAITRLKGILESQDYQTYVQENILTE